MLLKWQSDHNQELQKKGKIIRNRSSLKSNKVPGLSEKPYALTYGGNEESTAVVPYQQKERELSPGRRIGSRAPVPLILTSKRSTKQRDNQIDMSIFEGRVPSRFQQTRQYSPRKEAYATSKRMVLEAEIKQKSSQFDQVTQQQLGTTRPENAEIVTVESMHYGPNRDRDGSEDPEAAVEDRHSAITPKPVIKARDVHLAPETEKVRDSVSELLPDPKAGEEENVPAFLRDQNRVKYTDKDARDYATTPIEPVGQASEPRDYQADATPLGTKHEAKIESQQDVSAIGGGKTEAPAAVGGNIDEGSKIVVAADEDEDYKDEFEEKPIDLTADIN